MYRRLPSPLQEAEALESEKKFVAIQKQTDTAFTNLSLSSFAGLNKHQSSQAFSKAQYPQNGTISYITNTNFATFLKSNNPSIQNHLPADWLDSNLTIFDPPRTGNTHLPVFGRHPSHDIEDLSLLMEENMDEVENNFPAYEQLMVKNRHKLEEEYYEGIQLAQNHYLTKNTLQLPWQVSTTNQESKNEPLGDARTAAVTPEPKTLALTFAAIEFSATDQATPSGDISPQYPSEIWDIGEDPLPCSPESGSRALPTNTVRTASRLVFRGVSSSTVASVTAPLTDASSKDKSILWSSKSSNWN